MLSSSQEGTPSLHLRPPVPSLDDNTPPPVEQEGGVNEVALLECYPIYQGEGSIYQEGGVNLSGGGVNQDNTRVQSFTDGLGPVSIVNDGHDVIL